MSNPVQTEMSLSKTKPWKASGHLFSVELNCPHHIRRVSIEAELIGWIDQRGQVWLSDQDWMHAGGPNGSITPIFVARDCD
jgi:hypothetical protein